MIQPQQITTTGAVIEPQAIQAVIGVIMAIWMGAFVIGQVMRVFRGEEVERPPLPK